MGFGTKTYAASNIVIERKPSNVRRRSSGEPRRTLARAGERLADATGPLCIRSLARLLFETHHSRRISRNPSVQQIFYDRKYCPHHGRRGAGNLSVCGHYGKAHHRLLYCNTCKARFSEFKGTPLFNSKLPHDKVLAILEHLADGCGVRQTARLVGVNKDTVTRLALLAGRHAKAAHESWWPFPPSTREVQFDEKWSFVDKKQKNCDPADPADDHCGDYWDFVAYDPEHRLVLAVIPGARTEENGHGDRRGGRGSARRCPAGADDQRRDTRCTRRRSARPSASRSRPERGPGRPRVVPERRMPEGVVYATVHKHRKNGRVVAVEPRLVFGSEEELEEALGESGGQSGGEHVVRRAAERDRPAPQRAEGAEDVPVQQGLAGARGDDVLDAVWLQLLLVRADAAGQG